MSSASRRHEIVEVESYLATSKETIGSFPQWESGAPGWMQARWHIQEESGLQRSDLRLKAKPGEKDHFSVSLIFKSAPIWRVDFVPGDECKFNPHWAHELGAPGCVCGPHQHTWNDNARQRLRSGIKELPCRRLLPGNIRRYDQLLPWLADEIGLALHPSWRDSALPLRTDLFHG